MISRSELHLSEKQPTTSQRGLFGSLAAALAIGLVAASSLVLTAPAAAVGNNPTPNCVLTGDEAKCSFTYYGTGAEQTFTVPDGITSLDTTLVGGSGGSWGGYYPGGAAANVSQSITVSPGQSLYVLVAGNGQGGSYDGGDGANRAGGYNGGGWGGGAAGQKMVGAGGGGGSDIRTVPQAGTDSLASRVAVAGGGGGSGGCARGGDAGQDGSANLVICRNPGGGAGAGALGYGNNAPYLGGGGGGGLYGGGAGGSNAGGGGGTSLGTVNFLTYAAPSVTLTYTSNLSSYELNSPDTTAVAGDVNAYTVIATTLQGDSWDASATSTFTTTMTDAVDGNDVTFTKVGLRTVTARSGTLLLSSVGVTVTVGQLASLKLGTPSTGVIAGNTATFAVDGYDAYDNFIENLTSQAAYSTTEPTDKVIGNTIRFTVAGSNIVTAGYRGLSTNTTMTIAPADLTSITISPDATTVTAGTPQAFTVEGFDEFENSRGDLTADTAFTTTGDDAFTANSVTMTTVGTETVTATAFSLTASSTIAVTVAELAGIAVTPTSDTVTAGTSQAFTTEGFDRYGNTRGDITAVTAWSSTEPTDEFTANSVRFTTAGTSTVTASAGGFTADATLTVVPATLAVLVIEPAASALTAGDDVTFTTTGFDSFGNSRGDVTDLSTFSSSQPADEIRENVVGFTTSGTSRITARIGEVEAQATLLVTPGALASITVTPGSDRTDAGIAQTFLSEGFDAFGNSRGDLTADAILTSLDDTDVITANSIMFVVSGRNIVTATVDGIVGTLPLTVIAGDAIRITLNANATSVRQGDSLTFDVSGVDQYGNNLGDLSRLITLTSNWSEDVISGATVTFPHASPHIITATLNGVSTSVNIEVIPTPLASAILAITGSDSALPLAGALLALLLGATAVIARARRRQRA